MKYLDVFNKSRLTVLETIYNCSREDVCGCDLVERLEMSKNLISYHVKRLAELGLIKETSQGRRKLYSINENKKKDVVKILKAVSLID